MARQTVVISLGGSLVAPSSAEASAGKPGGFIDTAFLRRFKKVVEKHLEATRFAIIVGGGKPAREYQEALKAFGANSEELDWAGIRMSRANAKVVQQVFSHESAPEIVIDPTQPMNTQKSVVVGAGYEPGFSTDYVSVLLAKSMGATSVINLTNVDYVYDKDPRRFKSANAIAKATWKEFRDIVGDAWVPGMNTPFDPRAAKLGQQLGLTVYMLNGANLKQFENCLAGKPFVGTTIQ